MSIERGHAWLLSMSVAGLLATTMGNARHDRREQRAALAAELGAHNLELALQKCRGSPEQERACQTPTHILHTDR